MVMPLSQIWLQARITLVIYLPDDGANELYMGDPRENVWQDILDMPGLLNFKVFTTYRQTNDRFNLASMFAARTQGPQLQ